MNGTYQKLLSIVNYYPNVSPNDILKSIEYPPNYSMESFDAIITILGYQIEDYSNNLKREGLDFTKKRRVRNRNLKQRVCYKANRTNSR